MLQNSSTQIVEKTSIEYRVPSSLYTYSYLQGYAEPSSSLRYMSYIPTYLQYPYNNCTYLEQCVAMLIQFVGYNEVTSSGSYSNVFLPQQTYSSYGNIWAIKFYQSVFAAECLTLSGSTTSTKTTEVRITVMGGSDYLDISLKKGSADAYFPVPANCSIIVNLYRAISGT